jgi:predicted TIM-barrel fold metal-dependent hydrolase
MATLAEGVRVIDTDSHLTESPDLWTKRAPAKYRDRVPQVADVDGQPMWMIDGKELGFARGGGVIDVDGGKHPFAESMPVWGMDRVHRGAYDLDTRLGVLDECGIDHQVLYPNNIGLGGERLTSFVTDAALRLACVEIYNDAMAEIQESSNKRFLPMPLLPSWDIDASVREAERIASLGLRGVNMTSDPQDVGTPDLASPAWDPLWAVCAEKQLPIHFHIGASLTAHDFISRYPWPSHDGDIGGALTGTMLFINNARVVVNTIASGVFDRHPDLKMVSVESGVGWIPFILETLDYELSENAPRQMKSMKRLPSEYFKSNWYATYWFERADGDLRRLIERVGEDNVLFETDFPHPTCLYPSPIDSVMANMKTLSPETQRKVLGENATKLYRL